MFARYDMCLISDMIDVSCLNRCHGWYRQTGDLVSAKIELEKELRAWEGKYGRPMMMTEYGADTVSGLHSLHDQPWTETPRQKFHDMYHRVHTAFLLWLESRFGTLQISTTLGIFHIDGNKEGIFSRYRRPKGVVHPIRERWTAIVNAGHSKPASRATGPNL